MLDIKDVLTKVQDEDHKEFDDNQDDAIITSIEFDKIGRFIAVCGPFHVSFFDIEEGLTKRYKLDTMMYKQIYDTRLNNDEDGNLVCHIACESVSLK